MACLLDRSGFEIGRNFLRSTRDRSRGTSVGEHAARSPHGVGTSPVGTALGLVDCTGVKTHHVSPTEIEAAAIQTQGTVRQLVTPVLEASLYALSHTPLPATGFVFADQQMYQTARCRFP